MENEKIVNMQPNEIYITGGADFTIFNLPKKSKVGDTIEIYCTSYFRIQPLNRTQILFFSTPTSDGLQGKIESNSRGQWIKLLCTVDDFEWMHVDSRGNFLIV